MIGCGYGKRAQAGLTLVELMIALVLGLVLIGGALQVLQGTGQSYRLQENMSRLQENGRFAIEMMAREIRMAGFSQCGRMDGIDFHNNVADADGDADPAFDFNSGTAIASISPAGALDGSDALRIRHTEDRSLRVLGAGGGGPHSPNPNNANIKVAGNALGLQQGDVVTASDCTVADTFRITNTPNQTSDEGQQVTLTHAANANTSPKLQNSYGAGDRLMVVRNLSWFVAQSDATHADGTPVPALFRDTGDGPQAVVDGVRALRIRYALDDDGDGSADRYERAGAVGDWQRVVAVRLSLLLQTADAGLADSADNQIIFDNSPVSSETRRVLRVFNTTVALRNRGGGRL